MKSISTLLIFLTISYFGIAQPVISNVVPNFGDQIIYNNTDTAWSVGNSGANVNWDYTDQNISLYSGTYLVQHPEEVDQGDLFPDATMVWSVDLGFASLNSFMSFANNTFTDYGSTSGSSPTSGRVYDDPEIHFTYPLNYEDTGNDTYSGNVLAAGNESPITGQSSYVVDGYGSLSTPYGSYDNVLRMTTTKVENLITFGLNMTSAITETSWYSPEYPVPVFIITRTVDSFMGSPLDSSLSTTVLVNYVPATTGISELNGENSFEIYPNPAADHIIISSDFTGVAELKIYSLTGKMVLSKSVNNTDKIDLSNLHSGGYVVLLSVNGSPYAQKPFVIR